MFSLGVLLYRVVNEDIQSSEYFDGSLNGTLALAFISKVGADAFWYALTGDAAQVVRLLAARLS